MGGLRTTADARPSHSAVSLATRAAPSYSRLEPVGSGQRVLTAARNRDGEAGNVPNIATDYAMLELAGTIRVEPGSWGRAARMVLLQTDVAETALDVIDSRDRSRGAVGSLQALGDGVDCEHGNQTNPQAGCWVDRVYGTEDPVDHPRLFHRNVTCFPACRLRDRGPLTPIW